MSGIGDRCQTTLDVCTRRLFPGRQLQGTTEKRQVFVNGKAWLCRGDLEQHAARLAEVDRLEVAAIAHLCDPYAHLQQLRPQAQLLVCTVDRHCDMVHRTPA